MIVLKIIAGVAVYLGVVAVIARFCGVNTMLEELEEENEQR